MDEYHTAYMAFGDALIAYSIDLLLNCNTNKNA